MSQTQTHWNQIFAKKNDPELGWYEQEASQTLKLITLANLPKDATIFISGVGTSVLIDHLASQNYQLILNDISDIALGKLQSRLGTESRWIWLHHDVSKPFPTELPPVDLWIDRAVLHFLLAEPDIQGYFSNMKSRVRAGGYALFAEFSTDGASKCAGLQVNRYSLEELSDRVGGDFTVIHHEPYTYMNPSGQPRPYLYCLYQRSLQIE